jgi:hypothetical protein
MLTRVIHLGKISSCNLCAVKKILYLFVISRTTNYAKGDYFK